ncbi:hypothetical protein [Microbulbifer sp. SAOS-129_SWC]|uniref:hypothetical protein n=1 Tax=Microbulbifer sp. SAOS-129_SWC TaxID=3145235 RepID=UPI003216D71C
MSLFGKLTDWISPIDKGLDIVDQFVVDKDKRAELRATLEQTRERFKQLQEQSYQLELQTKTVPWIDGVHKMGRQLLSVFSLGVGALLLHLHPDIDPLSLGAVVAPGGIYNLIKGRGKQ